MSSLSGVFTIYIKFLWDMRRKISNASIFLPFSYLKFVYLCFILILIKNSVQIKISKFVQLFHIRNKHTDKTLIYINHLCINTDYKLLCASHLVRFSIFENVYLTKPQSKINGIRLLWNCLQNVVQTFPYLHKFSLYITNNCLNFYYLFN